MFLHANQVDWSGEYRLRLVFNNGAVSEIDLKDELDGVIFSPLGDVQFFRQVSINDETGTVEWPNGADFAPEFLFTLATGDRSAIATPAQSVAVR